MKKRLSLLLLLFLCFATLVSAIPYESRSDQSAYDRWGVWNVALVGTVAIILFSLIAVGAGAGLSEALKKVLFAALVATILVATVYFIGTTIYKNVSAVTKGPVHWHLDFDIYNCNEKVNLLDPKGMSNKIGSSDFHEHNDNRIHVEGPVIKHSDVNLRNFFAVIGGEFDKGILRVPTNNGMVEMNDGALCDGQPAKLQAFLFKISNPREHNEWVYTQEKLENAPEYVMSAESAIPPGDCVVFEFGPEKSSTENMCETYNVAVERGVLHGS